jgi:hypothetical protein
LPFGEIASLTINAGAAAVGEGGGVTIAAQALEVLSALVSFDPKITRRLDTGSPNGRSAIAVSAGTRTVRVAAHTQAAIRPTTSL